MLHTDHIRIDPAYRDALAACELDCVDSVLARTVGRVVAWSRTTDTLQVTGPGGAPGFYLKRYHYANLRRRLRGTFRGTYFGLHRGRAEYRLLNELRGLGLPAVRPVAYGARRLGHFVTSCFLITEEVPGAVNLTTFARDVETGRATLTTGQRSLILERLARQVAELHAVGFAHGQLFWRNVLLRFVPPGEPEFFLLDVRPRRGGRRFGRAGSWWLSEIAQLTASALPFTTRSERMRFLVHYFGARRVAPDIRRQAREIERLSRRWRAHEEQRIKRNGLFEEWNRKLATETARRDADCARTLAAAPGTPS